LQSVERSGGWPYIPRLQLRTFMDLLQDETIQQDTIPQEGTQQDTPEGGAPDDEPLAA